MAFSKHKDTYPARPEDINRMLTRAEVTKILDANGAGFVKDKRKVMHFVERAGYTLHEVALKQRTLDRTNMELRAQLATKGEYASTMNPEQALKYVDPVVLAQHADHASKMLAERAAADLRRMEAQRTDIQMEVLQLLDQPNIDETTQRALRRILKTLGN